MLGAIIGDIVSSRYETRESNILSKDFPLFDSDCTFTDDTVMTLATAEICIVGFDYDDEDGGEAKFVSDVYKKWCKRFPNRSYDNKTREWYNSDDVVSTQPSIANGAAMRIAPAAWFAFSLKEAQQSAKFLSEITHEGEGVTGAQAIASAVYMAFVLDDKDNAKEEIKKYIETTYRYNLSIPLADAHEVYGHRASKGSLASKSVPAAILAFLHGSDFEDVIRTAVSLGGDSGTIAAMAGSIAEAYYGIPDNILNRLSDYTCADLFDTIMMFERERKSNNSAKHIEAINASDKVCNMNYKYPRITDFGPSGWQTNFDYEDTQDARDYRNFWSDVVYWTNYLFRCNAINKCAKLNEKLDYYSCLKIYPTISEDDSPPLGENKTDKNGRYFSDDEVYTDKLFGLKKRILILNRVEK